MANEEGVKIVITAEDRFTANIKKIEASTKIFGNTAKNTQAQVSALEKEMVRLVTNGMDPANKKIVEMKANYDRLSSSLNSTQATLGKSSRQWTNIALVVQDLPYGFRAIQNNLPAVIGGLAGVGGAAYLAFSVIIAGFTMLDESQRKAAAESKNLKKEQESLGDQITESTTSARTQGILLQQYVAIARDVTQSDTTRNEALKKANELYGTHNEKLTLTNINTDKVKKSLDGYIESLIKLAVAEKYASQIADNIIEQDKLKSQLDEKDIVRQKLLGEIRGKQTNESRDLLDVYADLRKVNGEINKLDNDKKSLIGTNIKLTDNYVKALKEATVASGKYGETEKGGKGGKGAKDDSYINLLKSRIQLSKNDLDTRLQLQKDVLVNETENERISIRNSTLSYSQKAKAIENINETMLNKTKLLDEEYYKDSYELEKQDFALKIKLSGDNLEDQKTIYGQQLLSLKQRLDDGLLLEKDYLNEYADVKNSLLNVDKKINEELLKQQEKLGKDQVNVIKSELGVKLRLNKDNLIGQQEAVKSSMTQVSNAMKAAFGTGAFPILLQYYDELNGKLEAMDTKALRGAEAMKKVNGIISDMATNSIVLLGENIGKALGGETVDLFGGFLDLLSSGLQDIGKALIAYGVAMDAFKKAFTNPYAAIAAGIALVAAGALLKSRINKTSGGGASAGNIPAFANGGIVSGPTMGLMGEYPGAKSNPEVIAPLDKLKDMLGGGQGGTFVLRGQDLLLSVNRAQKASNIKGQTISLA
jgi:hypothetical protein